MTRNSKIITTALAFTITALLAQPASADNQGRSIGVGSNVRHGKPSMPAPGGGGYRPSQQPFVYGGFVPPSIVAQPNFIAPNYYLPGSFYAQSTYFGPSYSPVVVYPAPLTGGGFLFTPPAGGGPNRHNLTFGPLNR